MFTGIIEGLGTLVSVRAMDRGARLTIDGDFDLIGTKLGDSIAVNGACLTAVRLAGRRFEVDVSPETMKGTILGAAKAGDRVNLERALRLSDRIDGHLVAGHVDGIGTIIQRKTLANAILVTVSVPDALTRYMIHKGSVAVDGVSLTINRLAPDAFEVSIIPHTAQLTTVGVKKPGSRVNIETDMIGKFVERFVGKADAPVQGDASGIDLAFLAKSGFM